MVELKRYIKYNICVTIFICVVVILFNNRSIYAQNTEKLIKATYYHDKFENRKTSSGEVFSQKLYTAAHKTLPFHTIVKVTNKKTGAWVLVKINDRCARHGIIDMSKISAQRIGVNGVNSVSIRVLGKEATDIWQKQTELFDTFAINNFTYEQQSRYLDSLLVIRQQSPYLYYVRLTTVQNSELAMEMIRSLPAIYQEKAETKKHDDESFYYITIGPFALEEDAKQIVKELKNTYPLAHLFRINDN